MGDKNLFLLAFGCDGDLACQTTTDVCSMPVEDFRVAGAN
jgi:hypothetical protein